MVAHLLELVQVVARDDQRGAALAAHDDLAHLVGHARVETGGGLVEQDDVGVAEERLCERDAFGHAVRQRRATRVVPGLALDLGEDLVDGALDLIAGQVLQLGHAGQELAHGFERRQHGVLREDADLAAQRVDVAGLVVEHADAAFAGAA